MFGTEELFDYFECHNCGCLQIISIPTNIDYYYSIDDYYSFSKVKSVRNRLTRYFRIKRNEYLLFNKGRLGKLVNKVFPHPGDSIFNVLKNIELKKDYKVLDVGCGTGALLYYLNELGFKDLTGIDPYLADEIISEDLKICRISIQDIPDQAKFDLIIFNHSFEHLQYPHETILKLSKILSDKGLCIIRMPVKNDYIWNLYGVNWVQIDAPRHFYIHTIHSFQILLDKSGLEIHDVVYDSSEFQFYASEQIKKGIPLLSEKSYLINPTKSIFTTKEIQEYRNKAQKLNNENMGDQAIFFIKTE
ncbi:MAG: class I SAM-dependent methyltransferase [Methanobacterium sp.]|nr:class I SAM-dependent methyltransferase [Methanobacterium sp.]